MTFIDIAGKHKCHETVLFILDFCMKNFLKMINVFGEKGIVFSSQEELVDHVSSILETDTVILVKGSRSTRMDIVADKLKEF